MYRFPLATGANFITGYIFSAQPIELITHKDNTGFEPATTPLSEENVFAVSILNFGSGGENRTPTNGFGDHRTAIILHRNIQQDAFTFCQTCCHYTNSLLSRGIEPHPSGYHRKLKLLLAS